MSTWVKPVIMCGMLLGLSGTAQPPLCSFCITVQLSDVVRMIMLVLCFDDIAQPSLCTRSVIVQLGNVTLVILLVLSFGDIAQPSPCTILKRPSWSVNFISQVTSCVRLREEEPQTAFPMSFTQVSHIATSLLTGC